MSFTNLSFRKKILILLVLPMLGFLWLSISVILNSINTKSEMSTISSLTHLSVIYSELVHELQKERGLTAGYIGSNGAKFANKLQNQRQHTDDKRHQQVQFWQNNNFQLAEVNQLHSSIEQAFAQLMSIRQRVDSQSIPVAEALTYYTQLNGQLLSVAVINANLSTDALITKETIAYYNFLQGKERAGIERAVLSNTFAKDSFSEGMFIKFITLISEQDAYFANFNRFANEDNQQYFMQQLAHESVSEVQRLRLLAESKAADFHVKPEYWFAQATARIGQLKKIENELDRNILALVDGKQTSAINLLIINLLSCAVLIVLAMAISIYILKDLTGRVKNLTSVMSQVRHKNDLTVASAFEDDSELGQISVSLNKTLAQFSRVIKDISSSSISLTSASAETAQTCEYNSQSLFEQQNSIGLIASAIEQLSATVKEVSDNTQRTVISAKEADEKANGGLKTVQKSYHSIEVLAVEIDGLASQINKLHESSTKITSVVDVIKSVAEQTNLLALNAAIEAARAGEQGRGFAVVADEVRTLAQRTQESTAEIESFILALQSDATASFNVIETSQKKAAAAVESSKNVELVLEEITVSVGTIFAMTDQIATAVEEQAVVAQDVVHNIIAVEQKSVETTTGANQIAATAKEQEKLATSLQDIANTFKV